MKRTISLVLVLVLGLATKIANADFIFGEPTNLGPVVNSSNADGSPSFSADGLEMYFDSSRSGGSGNLDIWVAARETADDDWGTPECLGPSVNSSAIDGTPFISADGLTLYFCSERPGGFGYYDLWVTTRRTKNDSWREPVNLGPKVNSSTHEFSPEISVDGLSLYFESRRPGGYGIYDIWMTTRPTTDDDWGEPVNLGPPVNGSARDMGPYISADGLTLFLSTDRSGGYGSWDLWVTRRTKTSDAWGEPVNLGPNVNTPYLDGWPCLSPDGSFLYISSQRPGGIGSDDIWQVPIIPIVDFNGDGTIDIDDLVILIEYWGTDEPLCDIGPPPFGDGIVDVQDLIVLAEHLFEGIPPDEGKEVNVDEEDDGSQVELEQGQILVITLESNPTTGYRWEQAESQDSILQQMGETEFKPSETGEPPLVGAGGWEIFRFKAVSAGQMILQLVYHRPWEEGVEPLETFSLWVVVR